MRFAIKDERGKFVWALRAGRRLVAKSAQPYAKLGACQRALERIKKHAKNAPIVEGRKAARTAHLHFRISDARPYRWVLAARNNRPIALGGRTYSSPTAARDAIKLVKDSAASSPIDLPSYDFIVLDAKPMWGRSLKVAPVPPLSFVGVQKLTLLGRDGQRAELPAVAAGAGNVAAALPNRIPFPGPYSLGVPTPVGELPKSLELPTAGMIEDELKSALRVLISNLRIEPEGPTQVQPGLPLRLDLRLPGAVPLPSTGVSYPVQKLPIEWAVESPDDPGLEWKPVSLAALNESINAFFVPPLVDATPDFKTHPKTVRVEVGAAVTLSAEALDVPASATERVTGLGLVLECVPIPSLIVLFTHSEFRVTLPHNPTDYGCVLVLVKPDNVGISKDTIIEALKTLSEALTSLAGVFRDVRWLKDLPATDPRITLVVTALSEAKELWHQQPHLDRWHKVEVVEAAGIRNLFDAVKFWTSIPWHTGEDTFSSLFFVGRSNQWARCYNSPDYRSAEGYFSLLIPAGQLLVRVDTLHKVSPTAWPAGAIDVIEHPRLEHFGDKMSSLHFGLDRP